MINRKKFLFTSLLGSVAALFSSKPAVAAPANKEPEVLGWKPNYDTNQAPVIPTTDPDLFYQGKRVIYKGRPYRILIGATIMPEKSELHDYDNPLVRPAEVFFRQTAHVEGMYPRETECRVHLDQVGEKLPMTSFPKIITDLLERCDKEFPESYLRKL